MFKQKFGPHEDIFLKGAKRARRRHVGRKPYRRAVRGSQYLQRGSGLLPKKKTKHLIERTGGGLPLVLVLGRCGEPRDVAKFVHRIAKSAGETAQCIDDRVRTQHLRRQVAVSASLQQSFLNVGQQRLLVGQSELGGEAEQLVRLSQQQADAS